MDQPNLNMRQCRWLDMVKDYDCEILYYPRKANVVANSLSHKMASSVIGGLRMKISIDSPLLDLIRESLEKGFKE